MVTVVMALSSENESVTPGNAFAGGVKGQLYDALVTADEPCTAAALAKRADCAPAPAHEYLQSFVSFGVVLEHEGVPPTYEHNDAFREWEHVLVLADEHSLAELEAQLEALLARIQTYQERYGVDTPSAVGAATGETAATDLADWTAARATLRRYERARQVRLSELESGEAEPDDRP